MGWASGSGLMNEIIDAVGGGTNTYKERVDFYVKLIKIFSEYDCDTLEECLDQDDCYDEAFYKLHSEYKSY